MLSIIKKIFQIQIQLINKKLKRVIIIDKATSKWVKYCIPEGISFEELDIRNSIPIILSFGFVANFFRYFVKSKKLFLSFFVATILEKKSDIIISFTDNIILTSQIKKFLPNFLVISIQNGTRYKSLKSESFTNIRNFSVLYSWGLHEKKLIEKNGGKVEQHFASGSLKYGIYKKFYQNSIEYENQVIFLSQWRKGNNTTHEKIYSPYEKKNLKIILDFCKKNSLNFKICPRRITKDIDYIDEYNYFKSIIPNIADHFLVKNEELDSYKFCDNSKIIIHHHSSLGFEFFGTGKKTIFLGNTKQHLNYEPGWLENINLIPDHLKIFNDTQEELLNKLEYINNLDPTEYLKLISQSRKYYMNYQKNFSHEMIKNHIKNYLV